RSGASPAAVLARVGPGFRRLDSLTKDLLIAEARAQSARIADRLESYGAPRKLAQKVVRLFDLDGAVGLADLGATLKIDEAVLTR
ncbi:hypothetical protein, partial [Enterococcus faecium]